MKEKEPDVEIVDDETEIESSQNEQVVIDLEKKPEPKALEPKKDVQPKESDEVVKLRNTVAYQTRQLDKALREIQEIRAEYAASRPQVVEQPKQNLDEIDQIAQADWKKGVKTLVEPEIEKRVQDALKKRDEAQAEIARRNSLNQELEKSKQRVLEKYPDLNDDSTENASIYRQVLNEDVSLLSNIHGPEIAMYRMEERMRNMGKTPPSLKPMVDKEAQRLARAGASSVVGRTANNNGKITLTREQKEFCDRYSIPYDRYVKNLKATAGGDQ